MSAIDTAHGATPTETKREALVRRVRNHHPAGDRRTRIVDVPREPVIPDGWTIATRHESWVDLVNEATGERLSYIDPAWLRGPHPHPRFQHPDWCE
jgi:hypothetical protein